MKKIVTAFVLFTLVFSGCALFKKAPDKAVNEGVLKFSEVKKAQSKFTLKGVMNGLTGDTPAEAGPAAVSISIDGTGPSDSSDLESPKFDLTFNASIKADKESGSGQVELLMLDKKTYFNVKDFTISGEGGAEIKKELSSFFNVWWIFPGEEGSNPFAKLADNKKKIKELFKNTKFFSGATEDGVEDIQGIKTTRYRVEVDKEQLKKFIVELGRIGENEVTPQEEQAVMDRLKETEFSGMVWVGQDDNAVHRVKGTMAVQPKQGPSGSFDLDYTGWDYGKDVAITAPASPQQFNPFSILPLIGAFSSVAPDESAKEPKTDQPLGKDQLKTPAPK